MTFASLRNLSAGMQIRRTLTFVWLEHMGGRQTKWGGLRVRADVSGQEVGI